MELWGYFECFVFVIDEMLCIDDFFFVNWCVMMCEVCVGEYEFVVGICVYFNWMLVNCDEVVFGDVDVYWFECNVLYNFVYGIGIYVCLGWLLVMMEFVVVVYVLFDVMMFIEFVFDVIFECEMYFLGGWCRVLVWLC